MPRKVRFEELLPEEIEEIMNKTPIAYIPFGTLEWHGPHMALGNDAVKAHEICIRTAEKAGGVAVPPTYWHIGGNPSPWTTRFDPYLVDSLFYAIFEQMAHVGFKVMIAITGHYGLSPLYVVKKTACEFMYNSGFLVAPMAEYEVAYGLGYGLCGDHGAKWETSILWALRPELVDMIRLSKNLTEPIEGVGGEDPRVHASKQLGEKVVNHIVDQLSELGLRLLKETSPLDRARFLRALSFQTRFLENFVKAGTLLRTKEYEKFVDDLWKGRYVDAISEGQTLLSKIGQTPYTLESGRPFKAIEDCFSDF